MKQPKYKGKELLSLSVIDAARDGDAQAVESVLRYYEGLYQQALYQDALRSRRPAPYPGGRVHEAPTGNQAHPFYRQHELTKPAPAAETAYPFPVSVSPGLRLHFEKESPAGDLRRSIRQTDTFLSVPSHTAGAP